jgi:hypothetical protein
MFYAFNYEVAYEPEEFKSATLIAITALAYPVHRGNVAGAGCREHIHCLKNFIRFEITKNL